MQIKLLGETSEQKTLKNTADFFFFFDFLFMAVVIWYRASAFQLHVTQKPLAEVLPPRNPHPTETLAKRQTTSVKTQGLCVELVQKKS